MNEFKPGQLVYGMNADSLKPLLDVYAVEVNQSHQCEWCSFSSVRQPTEAEARELMPQVFEELDALRAEHERLKKALKATQIVASGFSVAIAGMCGRSAAISAFIDKEAASD